MFFIVFKPIVPRGFRGITFFPFVILSNPGDKTDLVLKNHEKIHLRQQIELLVVPFFIWYGIEFIYRRLQHKDWKKAYYHISFEREAYTKEKELNYLKNRKYFGFLKFI